MDITTYYRRRGLGLLATDNDSVLRHGVFPLLRTGLSPARDCIAGSQFRG
jgi:hypothetical protein